MAGFPEYESYDAVGLADLIARKQVSAAEVLEAAIARIEARNPALNAIVHKQYDMARAAVGQGLPQGPLHGVPYLLKDLYAFETGVPVSNCSRLYDGFVPDHDSTITERLKAAGMVIVGRTNSPEFGLNMATEPVRWGPTRNPWNLTRSAGGSSGGAAAAVAARMVPAAHATDGGGSIRIPAANCGLFGLKITRGRNPAGPDVGEGWSGLAGGHCVSISVRDSAAILDATGGPAPGDPYWAPPPARPFRAEVGADPGRLRIALVTAAPGGKPVHPDCLAGTQAAAKLCEELGHEVEEATLPVDADQIAFAMRVIIGGNLRNGMDLRLQALGREQRQGDVERITALWAQDARRFTSADYARALFLIHGMGRRFGAFFQKYQAMISPTLANPPLKLGATDMMSDDLEAYNAMLFNQIPFTPPFNVTGCPAASLPLHWTADGLPVGVQIGAGFGDEATIFRLASQIEAARPWADRRPPALAPVP